MPDQDNRIQEGYDQDFNPVTPSKTTADLDDLEKNSNTRSYNATDNDASSINDAEQAGNNTHDPSTKPEERGWENRVTPHKVLDKNKLGKAMVFAKKHKGFLGLASVFGVSGALLAGFFGPSSLIINMVQNLSTTNDSTSRSLEARFLKNLQNISKGDPVCATAKLTIKCSTGILSEKAIKQLNKKGITPQFKLDDEYKLVKYKNGYPTSAIGGYHIDLKDGNGPVFVERDKIVEFFDKPENRKYRAKILGPGGAINLRYKAWAGKHIYSKFYSRFNINPDGGLAAKVKSLDGKILDKLKAYSAEQIPGAGKIGEVVGKTKAFITDHLGKVKKAGAAYTASVAGCISVRIPSLLAGGVAAVQLAQILKPTMDIAISPGAMAQASGITNSFTPEGMDLVGTAVTEQTPRASDGKLTSAMDSAILLAAMGVNKSKLTPSTKFTPGYAILTHPLVKASSGVADTTKDACKTIMSRSAMYTAMAADVALTVAASATIIGGLIKIAATWAIADLAQAAVVKAFEGVAESVFNELAENKDIPNARGEELGDMLGTGAMAFFAAGGMARNLPVMSQSQLADASEQQVIAEQMRKEMDIASLSPFDTSSQYTFLGSIVHNIKFAMLANNSYNQNLLSISSNIARLPQLALSIATPKASAADITTSCDYAKFFGLDTGDPNTTPAINAAGLPCTAYTSSQINMSPTEAIELIQKEGWFNEDVPINMSDSIQDLVKSGFIKPETPLYDVIEECSDASTGSYLYNSPNCIVASTIRDEEYCVPIEEEGATEGSCASITDAGDSTLNIPSNHRSMVAINVFLGDYQVVKSFNGEDETPAVVYEQGDSGELSSSGEFAWIMDRKWYDDKATHYGIMKGHQANSGWYFHYSPDDRYAIDMSPPGFLGAPVYALTDGVVKVKQGDRNATFQINSQVDGKELSSLFSHGQNISVKDGDTVKVGQQVMEVGNTGNSSVPHIHWEVKYDGKPICGNDIIQSLADGQPINLTELTTKATPNCLGRS